MGDRILFLPAFSPAQEFFVSKDLKTTFPRTLAEIKRVKTPPKDRLLPFRLAHQLHHYC